MPIRKIIGRQMLFLMTILATGLSCGETHEEVTVDQSESPISSAAFTIAVLPDTQTYTMNKDDIHLFEKQVQWIVENRSAENIEFVLHEGDVTNNNTVEQWDIAVTTMEPFLKNNIPIVIALGNHDTGWNDVEKKRDTSLFNKKIPLSKFSGLPYFGGVFDQEPDKMDNSYHLFSTGEEEHKLNWLVLALEFGPRSTVVEWANKIISNYPDRLVIIVTHTYLYSDNNLHGSNYAHRWQPKYYPFRQQEGGVSSGVDLWDNLVKLHSNILLVFNGHVLNSGTGRRVSTGDKGNRVYQMLANYQMGHTQKSGWMRLVQVDPASKRISVRTYSPAKNKPLENSRDEFVFENVLFDPSPVPCSVPPGHPDFCNTCGPCGMSESDCDSDGECQPDRVCRDNVGDRYGLPPNYDVCEVRCDLSPGDTTYCRDCSPCAEGEGRCSGDDQCLPGLLCEDDICQDLSCPVKQGHADYCRDCGPCAAGEADCDNDSECLSGLICRHNIGPKYGYPVGHDVCEEPCPVPQGDPNFCRDCGPCTPGEADCDSDAQCLPGLICRHDVGAKYGLPPTWDVCEEPCPLNAGHPNFCIDCGPCAAGEADCDKNSECLSGLICRHNIGPKYGYPVGHDVCEEPCPVPQGDPNFCRDCGPCTPGEADCDSDAQCLPGLICRHDVGVKYGLPPTWDVCEEPCPLNNGHPDYCRDCGPCAAGEADCDNDSECKAGLVCSHNVGANYGLPAHFDVCE